MDKSKVKDTESDSEASLPMEAEHVNNDKAANGTDEPNNFAMEDDPSSDEDADANNDDSKKVPRSNSRSRKQQVSLLPKTPALKGQKRKSISVEASPANSKLPKFEPMPVHLETKTIYIRESDVSKYRALDRSRLITIPSKEGTFEVGDLIWAKMVGYPWWPCIISVDPETGNYSKITGASCKADRVYHVQYFGPEAYRGWTSIGMVMPFEGIDQFYAKINSEIDSLPKKQVSKVLEKCIVKPSYKKKWNESVSEAELALKLDKKERVPRLTFNYVIGSEHKEAAKLRKSNLSESLLSVNSPTIGTGGSVSSKAPTPRVQHKAGSTPVNNKSSTPTHSNKPSNKRKSSLSSRSRKSNKSKTDDVYDFDDESDGFENEPLPGLVFPKRIPKEGDFEVFFRKHFNEEMKKNPECNQTEIRGMMKEQWEEMSEDMRSLYIERKAIYEDESNMLVSKRSHFSDDYFNDDDSDYDYNDSDVDTNDKDNADGENGGNKENPLSASNNNSKPRRSKKAKKSENLFDKIKSNDDNLTPNEDDHPKTSLNESSAKRKSSSSLAKVNKTDLLSTSLITPVKPSVIKKEAKIALQKSNDAQQNKSKKTKENATNISPTKKLCFEESSDETNSSDAASVTENNELGSRTKKIKKDEPFCHECGDLEVDQNIIKCEGICARMYHKACINYTGLDNEFCCEECKSNKHKCFACKSETDMDTKKCEDIKCNRFYHLKCIENNYPIKVNESGNSFLCPVHTCLTCHLETLNDNEYRNNFRSKKMLHRCIFCPVSYHQSFCMPAGTLKVSKSYIICPDHFQSKQVSKSKDRHINVNYCFACLSGGNLICCESCPSAFHEECLEYSFDHDKSFYCASCTMHKQLLYGDIVWVKLGSYRWWPGRICHPDIVPDNVMNLSHNDGDFPVYFFGSHDYYWVNKGRAYLFVEGDNQAASSNVGNKSGSSKSLKTAFKLALNEASNAFEEWDKERKEKVNKTIATKPPPYQHISCNRYVAQKSNSNNNESNEHICDCKAESACSDDNCLNRISLIECDPKLCPIGENCKNQRFRKCEYAKCKPFKTESAGWGLMTLEDIKEGQFVMEYCGEVIDEKECDKRLKKIASTQSNFYFLNLDKDLFIDAGPKGNLARFMNHSCEPNCVTQKWVVNNLTRVGLFALHDIPTGTELTFNYNLDCRGNERNKCECKSSNCYGFIGARLKNEDAQHKRLVNGSGSKQKNGAKQKNSKKKSLSFNQMHEDACFKCGERGQLIMCDKSGCPKSYHLACIDLTYVPKEAWICPRHTCMRDSCNEPAFAFCSVCPNSLCKTHASQSNSLNLLPDNQFLCEDHASNSIEDLGESELVEEDIQEPATGNVNTMIDDDENQE